MNPLQSVKDELKSLAKDIRTEKNKRKQKNRGDQPLWEIHSYLHILKKEYRHKHIAYCLVRGRTREQIERPREDNKPSEFLIESYVKDYTSLICPDA